MCFYKDTQASLSKNSLQNFFLNKVVHNQKSDKIVDNSIQVKQEEDFNELPHKKIHISNDLFKDLLKLSTGDSNLNSNYDTTASEDNNNDNISPFQEANNFAFKREFETEKACVPMKPDNSYDILMMLENTNSVLQGFVNSQKALATQIKNVSRTARTQDFDLEESPFERLNRNSLKEKQAARATTNPTYVEMLSRFTKGRTSFPYALKLSVSLPSPILREKNIRIAVQLVRTPDGTLVENHGDMLLQISLHTWELPSNSILRNKAGNKVLQGEDECELKNGQGSFDKLQIDEVTSKFINGCIGVLVVAKRPVNFGTSLESLKQKSLIKIEDIQPLLVEKVIVKSKKKNQVKA